MLNSIVKEAYRIYVSEATQPKTVAELELRLSTSLQDMSREERAKLRIAREVVNSVTKLFTVCDLDGPGSKLLMSTTQAQIERILQKSGLITWPSILVTVNNFQDKKVVVGNAALEDCVRMLRATASIEDSDLRDEDLPKLKEALVTAGHHLCAGLNQGINEVMYDLSVLLHMPDSKYPNSALASEIKHVLLDAYIKKAASFAGRHIGHIYGLLENGLNNTAHQLIVIGRPEPKPSDPVVLDALADGLDLLRQWLNEEAALRSGRKLHSDLQAQIRGML